MSDQYNTLPAAGGLFDQHPRVIECLGYVLAAVDAKAAIDEKKQKAEMDKAKAKGRR